MLQNFSLVLILFVTSFFSADEQKLLASDGQSWQKLGRAVSMDGRLAAVGAPGDAGYTSPSKYGTVYFYKKNNDDRWYQIHIVQPSNNPRNGFFGCSVALDNGIAVIGATAD